MHDAIPTTPAIRALRAAKAEFTAHAYKYEERGGTAQAARELGIDDTKYVGIGNCILGYVNGDYPEAKPRKENYVYWIE